MPDRTQALLAECRDEIGRIADIAHTKTSELQAKVDDLTQRSRDQDDEIVRLKLAAGRGGGIRASQSLGSLVASHPHLDAMRKQGLRSVSMTITSENTSPDSGGALVWSDRQSEVIELARKPLTVRQLLPQLTTKSNLIEYARQVGRNNAAAPVAETTQKPESNYVWDRMDAPVRTLAHFIKVSRQAFDDAAQLRDAIDTELRYGLALLEETQLLSGSGSGQNLEGLTIAATAFAPPFAPSDPQQLDFLLLAMCQLANAGYTATGAVLHPQDWYRILLLKDAENRYLAGSPLGQMARAFWQLPIALSHAIGTGNFLVADFDVAATIFDRMNVEVLISSEDGDNFQKNLLTIRAEQRLALAIKRPAALITGDFGSLTG